MMCFNQKKRTKMAASLKITSVTAILWVTIIVLAHAGQLNSNLFLKSPVPEAPAVGIGPVTTAGIVTGCQAGDVLVDITVAHVQNVGAISLKLMYDNTILHYVGYSNSAIPASWQTPGSYITENNGMITVSALDPTGASPLSLANGATLFTLQFSGILIGSSDLTWYDPPADPTMCEYAGEFPFYPPFNDTPTGVYYLNGRVTVNRCCAIPTLSQWSLIILGIVLLGTGTVYLMRRRYTEVSV